MASLIEIDTRSKTDLPESGPGIRRVQDELTAQFNPANPAEAILVDRMASAAWRLERVSALQTEALDRADFAESAKVLGQLARYESTLQRVFEGALKALLTLRKTSARYEPDPLPPAPPSDPVRAIPVLPCDPARRPQVLYNEETASSGSVSDLPESQQCGPRTCLRTYQTSFSAFSKTCEAKAS